MKSVTVAGIDCGTNSIRLKVSRVSEDGVEDIVPRILRVIRLGQDVDKTHRFADEALARAYEAAREFAGVLAEHPVDGIRFVATSATRDAENREEFEDDIEKILGVRPEVIPGTEEADLSFLGATSIVHREVEAPYLVVDFGRRFHRTGAGRRRRHPSEHAGAGRVLHEYRVCPYDGASSEKRPADRGADRRGGRGYRRAYRRGVKTVPAGKTHTIIGVSGTVTTMTALAMGLTEYDHTAVDGARCTLEDAYAVDNRFLHMPREERLTYKTIHPGRVDVVGGGALVWNRVLAKVSEAAYEDHGQRIDSFMASEHGLLDGIVLDYGKRLLAAR